MKKTIIGFMVLTLFSVGLILPAMGSNLFLLSEEDERFINLTDKMVQMDVENDRLQAELIHKKNGEKFYWTVIGMFIAYEMSRNKGSDTSPDTSPDKHRHKHPHHNWSK